MEDDIPIAPSLYSLSNKMDNSLLAVRDINHKHIVVDWKIDYVFSHTCPLVYRPSQESVINFEKIDLSTEEWMDEIAKKLDYSQWYFGHYHDNIQYIDAQLLYEEIKELGEPDSVQKVGRQKYRVLMR